MTLGSSEETTSTGGATREKRDMPRIPYRSDGIVHRSRHNFPGARLQQRPPILVSALPRKRVYASSSNASVGHRIRNAFQAIPRFLADETRTGLLLIVVALIALFLANSPWEPIYSAISHYEFGPESLGLHLSVHEWAADGLLTIFFFVVGLELKSDFVTGPLRDIREAALPMLAAAFGMVGPATIYVLIQTITGSDHFHGWAVPTATDIAFAVALLGIFGRGLPPAARTFLLTLAVVDDLLAIIVIAVFYSSRLNWLALGGALLTIVVFGFLVQRQITKWWLLIPLAVVAWALMLNSGVHATIAGVCLGMVVPAKRIRNRQLTHEFNEKLSPWSAGLALPVFAFFAAGVPVMGGEGGLSAALTDPITISVAVALPLGKLIGIWGSVAILTRYTRLRLGNGVDLPDIAAIGMLAGIGFTVAMLVAGLAFPGETEVFHARFGVILGTFAAALLGAIALHQRTSVRARGAHASNQH